MLSLRASPVSWQWETRPPLAGLGLMGAHHQGAMQQADLSCQLWAKRLCKSSDKIWSVSYVSCSCSTCDPLKFNLSNLRIWTDAMKDPLSSIRLTVHFNSFATADCEQKWEGIWSSQIWWRVQTHNIIMCHVPYMSISFLLILLFFARIHSHQFWALATTSRDMFAREFWLWNSGKERSKASSSQECKTH